jgi:hypothetical protein
VWGWGPSPHHVPSVSSCRLETKACFATSGRVGGDALPWRSRGGSSTGGLTFVTEEATDSERPRAEGGGSEGFVTGTGAVGACCSTDAGCFMTGDPGLTSGWGTIRPLLPPPPLPVRTTNALRCTGDGLSVSVGAEDTHPMAGCGWSDGGVKGEGLKNETNSETEMPMCSTRQAEQWFVGGFLRCCLVVVTWPPGLADDAVRSMFL